MFDILWWKQTQHIIQMRQLTISKIASFVLRNVIFIEVAYVAYSVTLYAIYNSVLDTVFVSLG
jgi:VanZ family protein